MKKENDINLIDSSLTVREIGESAERTKAELTTCKEITEEETAKNKKKLKDLFSDNDNGSEATT